MPTGLRPHERSEPTPRGLLGSIFVLPLFLHLSDGLKLIVDDLLLNVVGLSEILAISPDVDHHGLVKGNDGFSLLRRSDNGFY